MNIKQKQFIKQNMRHLCLAFAMAVTPAGSLIAETSNAGTGSKNAEDAEQVQRIKEAVMQELRSSDFIQKQIEIGITAYIAKQRVNQQAAAAAQERQKDELAKTVRRIDSKRDHVYGDPKAKVTIIEYSDFDCPYCKKFHATPKQAVEKYNGQVNWVYRHFPLDFHKNAMTVAQASECAAELGGNDAFWKYTDALYARTPSKDQGKAVEKLVALATASGLDTNAFKLCLTSEKHAARVTEDVQEGARLGIQGTPGSILLNNETGKALVVSGALPFSAFVPKIEQLLN